MEHLIIILILVVLAIASFVGGVISLVKYAKTKNKLLLILGIIFTFIVPGILLYFAFRMRVIDTMIVYGPPPMMKHGPIPPVK